MLEVDLTPGTLVVYLCPAWHLAGKRKMSICLERVRTQCPDQRGIFFLEIPIYLLRGSQTRTSPQRDFLLLRAGHCPEKNVWFSLKAKQIPKTYPAGEGCMRSVHRVVPLLYLPHLSEDENTDDSPGGGSSVCGCPSDFHRAFWIDN